jgi:plastocyanin
MTDLFYVFGIGLTATALVISFFGLRSERFPGSRGAFAGALAVIGLLVVASCGFAIALSREEAEHRSEEVAAYEAEQEAEAEGEGETEAAPEESGSAASELEPTDEGPPAKAETLALTSPADGALVFDPEALEVPAGEVTIDYTNPSPVPHNVAIESDGEALAQGATVSGGESGAATVELKPGEYIFYCSIPGHRESGMEGALTVE